VGRGSKRCYETEAETQSGSVAVYAHILRRRDAEQRRFDVGAYAKARRTRFRLQSASAFQGGERMELQLAGTRGTMRPCFICERPFNCSHREPELKGIMWTAGEPKRFGPAALAKAILEEIRRLREEQKAKRLSQEVLSFE